MEEEKEMATSDGCRKRSHVCGSLIGGTSIMNTIKTANVIGNAHSGNGRRAAVGIVIMLTMIAYNRPSFFTGLRNIHAIRTRASPSMTPTAAIGPRNIKPDSENSARKTPYPRFRPKTILSATCSIPVSDNLLDSFSCEMPHVLVAR